MKGGKGHFITAFSFHPFRLHADAALDYFIPTNQSPQPLRSETERQYHLSWQMISVASAQVRNKTLVSLTLT